VLCSSININPFLFVLRRKIRCCNCRVRRVRLVGRASISCLALRPFGREVGGMRGHLEDVDVYPNKPLASPTSIAAA
jgi:hypothetical protein